MFNVVSLSARVRAVAVREAELGEVHTAALTQLISTHEHAMSDLHQQIVSLHSQIKTIENRLLIT